MSTVYNTIISILPPMFPVHYATQGAIVGINVFYFVRLQFSSKDGYTAPGTGTTGPSGYTSFPGDTDQPAAADDEDEHRKQYAPPEY